MKAWEIWSYQPAGWPDAHPCVVVSHPARVLNKPAINILMCSSQRATRQAEAHEVILDQADGLNWPTLCRCDLVLDVDKKELGNKRGRVTEARRRKIIETINRSMGWV